jgi:heme/copper-type cytochrome/quinol oxidase subunit 3
MHLKIGELSSEINFLFLFTYLILGAGLLILYLLLNMNPKLSLAIHAGFFPVFSILYLFLKWMPSVISVNGVPLNGGDPMIFSAGLFMYLLFLMAFLGTQIYFYTKELKEGFGRGKSG